MKIISKRSVEFSSIVANTEPVTYGGDETLSLFILEKDDRFSHYVSSSVPRRMLMGRLVECLCLDLIEAPLPRFAYNLEAAQNLGRRWLAAGCPSLGSRIDGHGLDRLVLRAATGEWIPSIFDLACYQHLLNSLSDEGVWGFPDAMMVLRKHGSAAIRLILGGLTKIERQREREMKEEAEWVTANRDHILVILRSLGFEWGKAEVMDNDTVIRMTKEVDVTMVRDL